jgi:formate-dependent nitrite reductase membrane component NrfD
VPDTFFTEPPHWDWAIILYFFIGGIAGCSLFLSALLHLFGRPVDRPVVRLGRYVAFIGALVSGLLLTVDLGRPERFWHMMLESKTWQPMLKYWAPMSVGVWGVLFFGLFAFLGALSALYEEGRLRWAPAGLLTRDPLPTVIAIGGAIFGLFLAGYTGVLLSVTNRPVWADSNWLGILFLFSAASSAAAALILLALARRDGHATSLDWLSRFDKIALVLELVTLIIFLISLGSIARVFLGLWGVLLLLGVILVGILIPLAIGFGRLPRVRNKLVTTSALVLIGGFLLRVVTILSSEEIHVAGNRVIGP